MLLVGQRVGVAPGPLAAYQLAPEVLLRHAVLLGGSGSGKTVASKVLIGEAIRSGIPSIVVDPQGDLASLAIPGDAAQAKERGLSDDVAREVLASLHAREPRNEDALLLHATCLSRLGETRTAWQLLRDDLETDREKEQLGAERRHLAGLCAS